MKAIILAAGAGTRLAPLTEARPKCLVEVNGRSLIDYQLEALALAGAKEVVLVLGYEAQQVRAHCGKSARYIDNPDYLTTNSIYSLYLAAAELDADTFLFNCDILFHPEVLQRLLAHPNAVAVDGRVERVAGEMNVASDREGRVLAISKQLAPEQSQAQSAQLVKFDRQGALEVGQEVRRLVQQQRRDVFPTSAYGPLITRQELWAVEVGDLPWGEIDSLEDYERVSRQVLPRLRGA
ncbi:MAG: phosphocholine cytidylyltransferase family protein [Candidatus Handelsmanbacteria bacterium]|nr:phosphocholine cytidylyltransferase family protein [Candidatus Handelsmanbacteria bacterium]